LGQIAHGLGLVANRNFCVAVVLPYGDDDERKQHGVKDADDRKFEPGDLVIGLQSVGPQFLARKKHQSDAVELERGYHAEDYEPYGSRVQRTEQEHRARPQEGET